MVALCLLVVVGMSVFLMQNGIERVIFGSSSAEVGLKWLHVTLWRPQLIIIRVNIFLTYLHTTIIIEDAEWRLVPCSTCL